MRRLSIAIDGPAGAGKSTIAKELAKRLSYLYIDTGAMYRAITYMAIKKDISNDEKAIVHLLHNMDLRMEPTQDSFNLFADHENITEGIRTQAVNEQVSFIAAIKEVRQYLVELQRHMAEKGGVILDGRDIGSVVLPNADIKFYLTASVEARAKRRWLEMQQKGNTISLEAVKESVSKRDYLDMHRNESPLIQVDDAIYIDSSNLSLEATVKVMMKYIEETVTDAVNSR